MMLVPIIWQLQNYTRNLKNDKSWHIATHLRVLSKSFPMNTDTKGFRWFSKIFVLWAKVASAFGGFTIFPAAKRANIKNLALSASEVSHR